MASSKAQCLISIVWIRIAITTTGYATARHVYHPLRGQVRQWLHCAAGILICKHCKQITSTHWFRQTQHGLTPTVQNTIKKTKPHIATIKSQNKRFNIIVLYFFNLTLVLWRETICALEWPTINWSYTTDFTVVQSHSGSFSQTTLLSWRNSNQSFLHTDLNVKQGYIKHPATGI